MNATWKTMPHEKYNQAWNRPYAKCWVKDFILTYKQGKNLEKYLKSACIKSQLLQKDFWSIMLKLQVTSRESPEIVRTTFLQNTS